MPERFGVARSVRLSPDDAWKVTERSHTGILTSLRRDGCPIALPVWFVVHGREIYVSTPSQSKKVARLRNDPRFSFLVEAGLRWRELVGVQWSGVHSQILGPDDTRSGNIRQLIETKYQDFRTPRSAMPSESADFYDRQGAQVLIKLRPDERFLSWDNSRLGLADP